jgi:hypothetical protein
LRREVVPLSRPAKAAVMISDFFGDFIR